MNIRQLRTFAAVVKAGSFAKAAEQEYISSSALIQQIQTLEKEVGCLLLERSPSGVRPTAAGQHFYQTTMDVLARLDSSIHRCHQLAQEEALSLSIGFFQDSLPCYTPMAVHRFQAQYPQSQVRLVPVSLDQALCNVRDGTLDICEYAYSEEIGHMGLGFAEFYSSPRYGLLASSHPLAQRDVLTREDLLGYRIAIHDFRWSPEIVSWCQASPPLDLVQVPCTTPAVYSIALAGGVYLMPQQSVDHFPTLHAIPLSPEFRTTYGYVFRKNSKLSVRQFLNAVHLDSPQS